MDFEKLDKELEKKVEQIAKAFDKRLKDLIKEYSVHGRLEASPKFHLYLKLLDKSAILVLSLNCAKGSNKQTSGKIKPT